MDMDGIGKRFIWVSAYAIAMAYLEAAIVVYLRAALNITDITAIDVSLGPYGLMEIGREAATMAMLAAVGWMAGRHAKERWAYGLFAFGVWDISYYWSQVPRRFCFDRTVASRSPTQVAQIPALALTGTTAWSDPREHDPRPDLLLLGRSSVSFVQETRR
jgi:hypothetical protein